VETFVCSICHRHVVGYGNNPQPVNDGRCCDGCCVDIVVPARLRCLSHDTRNKERIPPKRELGLPDGRCRWEHDDGGARANGVNRDGGCVPRAIAVATGRPYLEVLEALSTRTARYVKRYPRSWLARWITRSRNGSGYDPAQGSYPQIYGPYLRSLGWQYTAVEKGRMRLRADELPPGRLVVNVHRHLVAVIDGVIRDTYDSGQAGRRPVIGYYAATVKAGTN